MRQSALSHVVFSFIQVFLPRRELEASSGSHAYFCVLCVSVGCWHVGATGI